MADEGRQGVEHYTVSARSMSRLFITRYSSLWRMARPHAEAGEALTRHAALDTLGLTIARLCSWCLRGSQRSLDA